MDIAVRDKILMQGLRETQHILLCRCAVPNQQRGPFVRQFHIILAIVSNLMTVCEGLQSSVTLSRNVI